MRNAREPGEATKMIAQALKEETVQRVLVVFPLEGSILMELESYCDFAEMGLTREQVDHAIEVLEAHGLVKMEPTAWCMEVWLTGTGKAWWQYARDSFSSN